MSELENVKIVRKIYDDLNSHDAKRLPSYYADTARIEAPGSTSMMNKDQLVPFTEGFFRAFPDMHFDIKDTIAQGNLVAVTSRIKGTQKGPLETPTGGSIPPTNRKVDLFNVDVYELQNDKVIRHHICLDELAMLQQLGLVTDVSQVVRTQR